MTFGHFPENSMAGFREWLHGLLNEKEDADPASGLSQAPMRPEGPRSFAKDNNDFALALYGQLLPSPGNLFFAPFSIRAALAMAYAGARGETAAQLSRALRFTWSDETLHGAFAEIIRRLNAADGGKYEMVVAVSLWGQHGALLQTGFLDLVARHYDGGMKVVDFRGGAGAARATINQWCEDMTKRKIRELIPSGGLDADTRLVLANAIYFKGTWVMPFPKAATCDEPFYLEGGGKVQAPLMHQHVRARYLQTDGFQAVDLDYRGDDLSMLVLLPDKKDGLRDFETRLSERSLHDCMATMPVREVELFLPKFKMTWGAVDLRALLRALGMPLAFTHQRADFSGINGYEPSQEDSLFLSGLFHKAFVDVNEEGTEVAAAMAAALKIMSTPGYVPPPVPIFRADHPFVFAIRDRKSSAILFLGRMADPLQKS